MMPSVVEVILARQLRFQAIAAQGQISAAIESDRQFLLRFQIKNAISYGEEGCVVLRLAVEPKLYHKVVVCADTQLCGVKGRIAIVTCKQGSIVVDQAVPHIGGRQDKVSAACFVFADKAVRLVEGPVADQSSFIAGFHALHVVGGGVFVPEAEFVNVAGEGIFPFSLCAHVQLACTQISGDSHRRVPCKGQGVVACRKDGRAEYAAFVVVGEYKVTPGLFGKCLVGRKRLSAYVDDQLVGGIEPDRQVVAVCKDCTCLSGIPLEESFQGKRSIRQGDMRFGRCRSVAGEFQRRVVFDYRAVLLGFHFNVAELREVVHDDAALDVFIERYRHFAVGCQDAA